MTKTSRPPLAVVGVSALFPGSSDATGFWRDILAGADLLGDIPESHWLVEDYFDPDPKARDKTYARRGGFLDPVDFDPVRWGVPPKILKATDSSQLLALIVAERVLRDATRDQFKTIDRGRMSVILGVTSAQELLAAMVSRLQRPVWVKALREQGLPEDEVQAACDRIAGHYVEWEESSFPGLLGNVVAGRIANRLDLGGTNCVTDAACASTFSALSMAAQELYLGDSDLVITGGVDTLNEIFMFMCFSKTPALSRSGDCRPFSDKADGTMLGEGLGMVALRRLEDAERDGDRIYAVLRGIGSSSDGRSKSVYAPLPAGQAKALRRAYERAGYDPETVELLEAHGTGTKAGDAAEFAGLNMVFKTSDDARGGPGPRQWCALGSVKSQIGHTKAAAGAAGLFKAVMALHHKVLPPTAKIERPNPALDLENSAFYLSTRARPWIRASAHPRRAGVSAFGFGGSNFHVTLEEYTGPAPRPGRLRTARAELLVLSAGDVDALIQRGRALLEFTRAHAGAPDLLAFVARDHQRRFDASAPRRLAIVADDVATLSDRLRRALERVERAPQEPFELPDGGCYGVGAPTSRAVAFLFPGQGSQYVGMGESLAMHDDDARAVWDRAADLAFVGDAGTRVDQIVFPPPRFSDDARAEDESRLRATRWAQPAIGCASLALLAVLRRLELAPQAVAGHSFGELTALHAAGVLRERDLLLAARRRGELMEQVDGDAGAMTAVSAAASRVRAALGDDHPEVVLANHNAPEQLVLSGPTAAIERAEQALARADLRHTRLPVAAAFHSPVVAPSAAPFTRFLADIAFQPATIPVYAGETGRPYEAEADRQRARLGGQIAAPVRFVELVTAMADAGVDTFIEVGPGAVLTGLVGRVLEDRPHVAVALDRRRADGIESLTRALARLSARGLRLNLDGLWHGYREPLDPSARPKPRLVVPISGTNHGKLYPPPGGAAALPRPNPPRPEPTPVAVATQHPESTPRDLAAAPKNISRAAPPPSATRTPIPVSKPTSVPMKRSPVAAAPVPPSTPSNAPSDAWLAAWREAQQQTAQAHAVFQQSMAESHAAYLRAAESSIQGLASLAAGGPAVTQASVVPAIAPATTVAITGATPSVAPVQTPAPAPIVTVPVAPAPALVAVTTPVEPVPVAPPSPAVDLQALMLEVVADKTGYPAEMLELSMDMEAELGIDSIKRVEILAAVQEQAPGLPPVDANHMGSLKTLGEIVDYMRALMPEGPAAPAASPAAAPSVDLQALMLEVVADKTGYPAEMLELSMDMEAELGIDSIKRVEILAAVQEQAPGLPPVDANHMGSLKTLGEIVDYMRALMPEGPAAPAAATSSAPAVDLQALMLEVVADKTGYPAEMLELSMDMEAELGIDSIKRVEILAAVQEQAPGLPPVDANHMGSLKTLGEIVDYMRGIMPEGTAAPAAATSSAPAVDLQALMLEVVADKTGYPAEMLELSMDMEAELGIDSIKRVEILAAVQEQAPGLPPVDANHMGSLKTLGEIVDYMRGLMPQGPASEKPPAAPAPVVNAPALGRFALDLVPAPAIGLAQPGLYAPEGVIITPDGGSIAVALVDALARRGVRARVTRQVPADARAVVFLGGLRALEDDDDDAAVAINHEAFGVARTIAAAMERRGGLFVTVQDTGGAFGIGGGLTRTRALLAGLPALVKTAKQEWPTASLKAIDIARAGRDAAAIGEQLAQELLLGGGELEVALAADGARGTLRSIAEDVSPGQGRVNAGETVVVSGGARGVTAACVRAWARETAARFVLLGRTELAPEPARCQGVEEDGALKGALIEEARSRGESPRPKAIAAAARSVRAGREIRETLAAIAAAGAEARYLAVDVTDGPALTRALDQVRSEWGPIAGLVHGAGVIADKRIATLEDEAFARVFNTKITGLRALLAALRPEDPLRVLCLFSSVSARCGNNGQSAYAMANEVLNKLAQSLAQRRRGRTLVKALDWGPWEGGMVNPQLRAHFDALGVPMIPLDAGARMFVDELRDSCPPGQGRVELVLGGEPRPEALLSKGSAARTLELEVRVDRNSHGFLADHAIGGMAVVPVVLVIEWFSRIARAFRPDLRLRSLANIQVLSGVKLSNFDAGGDRFTLRAAQLRNGEGVVLGLELAGADGKLHYRAEATLAEAAAADPRDAPRPQLRAWTRPRAELYGDVLFHGDEFQVIEALEGIGEEGIAGTLRGVRQAGWAWDQWQTDVAAHDGGLQLAVLWARAQLGRATLPMGVGALTFTDRPPHDGPIRCVARCRETSTSRALADLYFLDDRGACLSEWRGAELVSRPDMPPVPPARGRE